MEIKRYATLFVRWARFIVLFCLVGAALGYAVSATSTRIYQASTTLLISQAATTNASADYQNLLTSERQARTFAQMIQARPVLEKVMSNLQLKGSVLGLGNQISVNVVRDTQLLIVSVEDPDPGQAARIANNVVTEFTTQYEQLQTSRYAVSKTSIETELASVQADMRTTQASIDALPAVGDAVQEVERNRLNTLMTQYQSSTASLLRTLEDMRLAESRSTDNVVIVESAQANNSPVRPRTATNVLIGLILGLLAATSIVFIRDYLDDSIKSADEVEKLISVSPLGGITMIEGATEQDRLITSTSSRSPVAEAYRVLAANIEFAEVDNPIRALIINSGSPSEGKSTTTANLAVAIAQMGKRVIVVDADLRKPTLHKYFGQRNASGVTTALLSQPGQFVEHLVPTGIPNLAIMPSGPIPPNPAELVGSHRMSELIEELKSVADIVIFDTPPSLVVADASLLARKADAVLLVVQSGTTRIENLKKAKEQLSQSGGRLVGFVLNRVAVRAGSYYYYYGGDETSAPRRRYFWQRKSHSGASTGSRRRQGGNGRLSDNYPVASTKLAQESEERVATR